MNRSIAIVLYLFAMVTLCASTRAAVRAESPDAIIALAPQVSPIDRLDGSFSVIMWVFPDQTTTDARSIFEIPGVLSIGTNAQGNFQARLSVLENGNPDPVPLIATTGEPLVGGQWQIIALSFRASSGILEVYHRSGQSSVVTGTDSGTGAVVLDPSASAGPRLGSASDGTPAMLGVYGLLVFRSEMIKASDADSLYLLRRYFGPYDTDSSPNGLLTGPDGAIWMLNHAISTLPTDIDAGGVRIDQAAVMNQPVGLHNVHVYDDSIAVSEENERFIMIRQAIEVSGFQYVSYRDPPLDGFFLIDPGPIAQRYPSVPGDSPLAAQLASHPRRSMRVIVSANSRAVFRDDGTLTSPGNYAHGFIDAKRDEVSGVYFRPAVRGWGGPWFGLDCTDAPLHDRAELLDSVNGPYQQFARFWTGSARAPAEGPGGGLFIEPAGFYEMRCRPEPGSLMVADAPLIVEAEVLAFPGASDLAYQPRRGTSQRDPGVDDGPIEFVDLNTETYEWSFHNDDRVLSTTAFVLKGQHEGKIIPGDAMFISSGPGAGHLSIIKTVQQGITQTTIEVTMPMALVPAPGSKLHFGPWHFERVSHTFEPVPDGDPNDWRGLYLAPRLGGNGFPVFCLSAWRPDVPGYIFGVAGWGGNGYLPQMLFSEDDARPLWIAESRTDLWIQVPAQQNSEPASMGDWTNEIRAGLPDCEIVWAGEAAHPSGTLTGWTEYIVDHAAEYGVVGIAALNRTQVGSDLEQLVDGHRSNLPHINKRGNLKLAQLWLDLLAEAANDPCPADFAPPWGVYDFFDLQMYLVFFAQQAPVADLTNDGIVDFFDIQVMLNAFAAGCP